MHGAVRNPGPRTSPAAAVVVAAGTSTAVALAPEVSQPHSFGVIPVLTLAVTG
jgi:hypothetical protein